MIISVSNQKPETFDNAGYEALKFTEIGKVVNKYGKFEKSDDLSCAEGDGWNYCRVGIIKKFTQTGRIKSLRLLRVAIKKCELMTDGVRYF